LEGVRRVLGWGVCGPGKKTYSDPRHLRRLWSEKKGLGSFKG